MVFGDMVIIGLVVFVWNRSGCGYSGYIIFAIKSVELNLVVVVVAVGDDLY
jgi:hypothetical protein